MEAKRLKGLTYNCFMYMMAQGMLKSQDDTIRGLASFISFWLRTKGAVVKKWRTVSSISLRNIVEASALRCLSPTWDQRLPLLYWLWGTLMFHWVSLSMPSRRKIINYYLFNRLSHDDNRENLCGYIGSIYMCSVANPKGGQVLRWNVQGIRRVISWCAGMHLQGIGI